MTIRILKNGAVMCEKLEKLCQSWQAWRMNREPSLGLVTIPGCRQPTFFSKEANFAFREADLQLRGAEMSGAAGAQPGS